MNEDAKKCECYGCHDKMVLVDKDYEERFCCDGGFMSECVCGGQPINPVFCDACEIKIFGH